MNNLLNESYMSVTQVSKYLGVARNTVLKYIKQKGLPADRIGKLWKIKPTKLENWIKSMNIR